MNLNQDSAFWLHCLVHFTEVLRTSPYLGCLCAWEFQYLYFILWSHIEEVHDIDSFSTESQPTSSNTMTPSGPVESLVEESMLYPSQTGITDSDAKIADDEPPVPVNVSVSYSVQSNLILALKLNS